MDISINATIDSFEALTQACVTLGVDGDVSYRPPATDIQGNSIAATCSVINTSADQATVQLAVNEAQIGALTYNKIVKIDEVDAHSESLFDVGFTYKRVSDGEDSALIPNDSDTEIAINRIERVTAEGAATYPQYLSTLDGRGTPVNSVDDLNAVRLAQDSRGVYILGAHVNGDGSMGQGLLDGLIGSAPDQATLDAIVDTRS